MARLAAALALAAAVAPGSASAGASPCRIEAGVLVAAAEVGGLVGDFIIDVGATEGVLDATAASGAGYDAASHASLRARLAGGGLAAAPFAVEPLDARTRAFPTPIAGVIGAGSLPGGVIELRGPDCRVSFTRAPFAGTRLASLPLVPGDGPPRVWAMVSDGVSERRLRILVATGVGGLSLDPASARIEGPPGSTSAPLASLALGAARIGAAKARLIPLEGAEARIGADILSRYDVRLDLKRRRLDLYGRGVR